MRSWVLICAVACVAPGLILGHTRFARNDAGPIDFTGHRVIRMKPTRVEHSAAMRNLEKDFEMDYWNPVLADLAPVLAIVDPQRAEFLTALNRSQVPYEIVTNNYQAIVDAEKAEMAAARSTRNADFDYENSYHTYDEIIAQIKYLATTYPTKASYVSVGTTYEGREIPAIIIGSGSKVIFLECGIHSREWVTIAFGTWVANYLLTTSSLESYLSTYTFIVIPVLNVDGFVFTHTSNRLWRKTRSLRSGSTCYGADPNRNWDTSFCSQGASTNPCSETYCGISAFSEVEAKQMSTLIDQYKSRTVAYFAVHSYSQLWMWPWGYTTSLPPNSAQLTTLSNAALAAIKAVNGLDFVQGSIANAIYLASGSSADWAYDAAGVQVSFALELRDKGTYGFQLPANQIKPAVYETWAGVKAVIDLL